MHTPIDPALILRDPDAMLRELRAQLPADADIWIFGYASLIWRPEFDTTERRMAYVHGWHRSFRMRSRVNRGTPEQPGLVFALMRGGSCHGVVDRLRRENAETELQRLWHREMPTGVYDPRWLRCRTTQGPVTALAFTLSHASEHYLGPISDAQMLHFLRHARGRYGSTWQYLEDTARSLRKHGLHDREIERLVALARRHGIN